MLGREKRKERFKEKLRKSKEIIDVLSPIVIKKGFQRRNKRSLEANSNH
jgi:hypothetical protein